MAAIMPLVGERRKGETKNATIACNDYLRMGPRRSLTALLQRYREIPRDTAPTQSLNTLQKWSQRYNWQVRTELYDAQLEAEKNAREAARRREIMESGLSLPHERVLKLKEMVGLLLDEVYTEDEEGNLAFVQDNVWLPDVKQIGGGEYAERVDLVRFNSAIFDQLRGLFDDLAKETGGRRQRNVTENIDYSKLSDEQLARIAAGEDPIRVILSGYSGSTGDSSASGAGAA